MSEEKTMKNTEQKIPALRFPEFSGEWEEKRLGEVCNSISSGKTKANEDGDYPVYGSMGIIGFSNTATHNGQYLLVARVGANAGSINIVSNQFSVTDNTLIVDTKSTVSLKFIYQKLISYNLNRLTFGSGQPLITGSQLKKLHIHFPSLFEQQKIANFLSAVDKRLQLLKDKKTKLEEYKRGVMQRIFSQELRFTRPDGSAYPDWEEKKLGEMGFFTSGTGFSEKEQGGVSGIPFYKVSDMNMPENIQIMQKANNYVSDKQIIDNRYKVIKKPSIIFAKVGAAIFLERKRVANNFLIDNNMMSFTPAGNIMFFFQLFQTIHLSKFAQVGALPSYNASDVSSIRIIIPTSEDEQRQIADFLSAIDNKISLLSKQIESTEQYKKGLLQQMFV